VNTEHSSEAEIRPTDLRGILRYVPMFRDQVFVIALDGALLSHESIQNVLLDIAVLRSLNIRVVLVHGIGAQMKLEAASRGLYLSDAHGEGPTDEQTLDIALRVATLTSHQLMQGLTRVGLRGMLTNAVRATEVGVVHGIDQGATGKIDKIDRPLFQTLFTTDCVPVISPIAFSREGQNLRLNSDHLASALAGALSASKLIFMTTESGLQIEGSPATNLPLQSVEQLLENASDPIPSRLLSKVRETVRAIKSGVPRAHILDGRTFGALLNEIFDKVGVGTMVYSNAYQSIRQATDEDATAIYNITRNAVKSEALKPLERDAILAAIDEFLVFEIDGSIVACARLIAFDKGNVFELASVFVQSFYQQRGVGRTMVAFACEEAKQRGAKQLFALSTQASPFFQRVCGFSPGSTADLPGERQQTYKLDARNSRIWVKNL
jgi:amino-acid N-acetyltransferase